MYLFIVIDLVSFKDIIRELSRNYEKQVFA